MPRARRARVAASRGSRLRVPELKLGQLERDLLGLLLAAFGIWGALVGYLGSAGGALGRALVGGFELALGVTAAAVPPALVLGGLALVARPLVRPPRRLLIAALLAWLAIATVAAGGLFGVTSAPAGSDPQRLFAAERLRSGGGAVGAAIYGLAEALVQRTGVYLLVLFTLLAALLLATGRPLAELVSALWQRLAPMRREVGGQLAAVARTRRLPLAGRHSADRSPAGESSADPVWSANFVDSGEAEVPDPAAAATITIDPADRFPDLYEQESAARHTEIAPESADAIGRSDAEREEQIAAEAERAAAATPEGAERVFEAPPEDVELPTPSEVSSAPAATAGPTARTPQGALRGGVTFAEGGRYELPAPTLLRRSQAAQEIDTRQIERTGRQLVEALGHFNVEARVIGTIVGPHVTRFELRLAPGTKMAKIAQLKDDLAYALAAEHVRILAPIPGKQAVGVEVPNRSRRLVHLGDVFQEPPRGWSPLTVWLGKDIAGNAVAADIAKQPHILVAGATGSGKSGCVNAMLSSILMRASPNEVRMVLVDPKRVELNHYEQVPHLLTPVVTSPRAAANVLSNLVREMEERYGLMSRVKARSLPELNRQRARAGEPTLPYILCVIDELADLMMIAPAEVEDSIIRLAQKSRAVGIHLVLATQRPSADVITGLIKANIPARIAFAVSSQTDSRVILDQNGAESLLGQGDMLFRPAGASRLARIQGAFISEEEIARLTAHWHAQGEPELREELLGSPPEESDEEQGAGADADHDPLLAEAIRTVVALGTASTSMLQRRLRVGYTRAGRLIDMMERLGVVSGYEGSKARQVLIGEADLPRILEIVESGGSALDDTGERAAGDLAPDAVS
ncbi:DNA segregation ATPase FtsK/SpoIIIE, S-DNA-T family [Thermoleophilum album]|uniref:DNA segregation ATPase FtsK/SpoIIIE, S-DNA-T family n=1 Tax=Thermoleophilum album TaxID=29539 RepID=A0A1H6FUC0_THEAL|nr:DNA segregation ATPase FtsK/SpoIIIE, S-DNA-T family [Thermoleophilum album]